MSAWICSASTTSSPPETGSRTWLLGRGGNHSRWRLVVGEWQKKLPDSEATIRPANRSGHQPLDGRIYLFGDRVHKFRLLTEVAGPQRTSLGG